MGLSLLDSAFSSPGEAQQGATNSLLLGVASLGGPSAFKLLRMLSGKFRKACAANSFTGETLVSTEFGLVSISDINIGDKVWAYDEESGENTLQEVIHLIRGEGEKSLVDITLASGEVITATVGHPIYSTSQSDWVDAGELTLDDLLREISGADASIVGLRKYSEIADVYNLTVANDHTYFVGVGEVLGHNAGICPDGLNIRSIRQFGHIISRHGSKRPLSQLIDRARTKGPQGQWLDDKRAAEFLAVLSHGIDGTVIKRLPPGMGRVVTENGVVHAASYVFIKPSDTGLRTAFPILEDHRDFHKFFVE